MTPLVLLVAGAASAALALTPALRRSRWWRATVTPLSSIIGSGFLVCAPLLVALVGRWAPLAMGALLAVAWGLGAVIRWNIRWAEPVLAGDAGSGEHRGHLAHAARWRSLGALERGSARGLERASHVVLAGAYVVSVAYYLQLLGVFVTTQLGVTAPHADRALTTAVVAGIALLGAARGLQGLEGAERWAVAVNLGVVVALLVGLLVHDGVALAHGAAVLPTARPDVSVGTVRSLMGLLIVVQGFETSRFLGAEHPAEERIATMRAAQAIAAAVYLLFLGLALVPLAAVGPEAKGITGILEAVRPVAPVLPALVAVAGACSQGAAAIADDAGCAGLLQGALGRWVSARWVYVGIGAAVVGLCWATDVVQVISLASRAFALFYALQCGWRWRRARGRLDPAPVAAGGGGGGGGGGGAGGGGPRPPCGVTPVPLAPAPCPLPWELVGH
ncbi:MAG: hypothetical protein R3F59_02485 [Myxococcota bacterium]